ncbi:MAG: hypothetical protein M3R26_00480 [Actinomycetota bacterium]|nr:hypothetical protein [Actinomycetota bacterium]MDQ2984426.1 hypothetical protein [Actinomycetota bacterium]
MKPTFYKGIVLGAVVSMLVLVASAAIAGTGIGGIFNLGQTNTVNATSWLNGATAAPQLKVTNSASAPSAQGIAAYTNSPTAAGLFARNNGGGPAAAFSVLAGIPPFSVGSSGKVNLLNSDLVDGFHAASAPGANRLLALDGRGRIPAAAVDGAATQVFQDGLNLPQSAKFGVNGGALLIFVTGTGFRFTTDSAGFVGTDVYIDGVNEGSVGVHATNDGKRVSYSGMVLTETLAAGPHTMELKVAGGSSSAGGNTNFEDRFNVTAIELPFVPWAVRDGYEPNDTVPTQLGTVTSGAPAIRKRYPGTIYPAGDVDLFAGSCDTQGSPSYMCTVNLSVSGPGVKMDVEVNGTPMLTDGTTFNHSGAPGDSESYTIRVHAPSPTHYQLDTFLVLGCVSC